jgi:hypothetical protein
MAGRCTVCMHPDRLAIDQALVSGAKQADLVSRYNLASKHCLSRHSINHIPAALAKAQAAAEVAEGDNLLGLVLEHQATARRIAKDAEAGGEKRTVLLAVRELLRIVELQAKLAGQLSDGPTVNVVLAPQWLEVRNAMLVALAPFPDARTAVATRLLELEAGDS